MAILIEASDHGAPIINRRLGKVVEAEILRRFGTPVCFDPVSSPQEFLLVVSVGRCKFRLSSLTVGFLLQSVLGGSADAFPVFQLDDRVFRFSVHSKLVGFHIAQLHSFECSDYKVFFHLWHGGGPNYIREFQQWEAEQAAEWTYVSTRHNHGGLHSQKQRQAPVRLGANAIPILDRRPPRSSPAMAFSKFKSPLNDRRLPHKTQSNGLLSSISNRDQPGKRSLYGLKSGNMHVSNAPGVLGPVPDRSKLTSGARPLANLCPRCLALAHERPFCNNPVRCRKCLRWGHKFRPCLVPKVWASKITV